MKLRDYIAERQMSIPAFGRSIGVHNRQTIWRYVTGENLAPWEVMQAVAEITEGVVKPEDFVAACAEWAAKRAGRNHDATSFTASAA